jgi:DNA-binding NtrC family response regulator
VILDYLLPDMDGVSVLNQLRKTNKTLPVIMFTAHPNMKAMEATQKLGISAFIPKLSAYSDTQSSLKTALKIAERSLGLIE